MAKIFVLHGPNLNLLGSREPQLYGTISLHELDQQLAEAANDYGHELATFQSNAEHDLINVIHQAYDEEYDFIIFNPGAFTHTSIALRDALLAVAIPFVEVHISNIHTRESFRQHSYFSDIAQGVVSGFGVFGYELALSAADQLLTNSK